MFTVGGKPGAGSVAAPDAQVPTHACAYIPPTRTTQLRPPQHHHSYVMFIEQEQELQDPMTSAAMDKALRVIERMVRPTCFAVNTLGHTCPCRSTRTEKTTSTSTSNTGKTRGASVPLAIGRSQIFAPISSQPGCVSRSDAYRNGKGSMLPLWRFTTDDVRAVNE